MNDELIDTLIKSKAKCFFISPHLDDAAFSAGELMIRLSGKVDINVINIFTASEKNGNTLSANMYLKQCKINDPKQLYKNRIDEDHAALSTLNARVYDFGYVEALWRKDYTANKLRKLLGKYIPEFIHLYPFYKFNIVSGRIHPEDKELILQITKRIKNIIGDTSPFALFCPAGIGNHVDHLIVRDACLNLSFRNTFFWADYPYCLNYKIKNDFIKDNPVKQYILNTFSDKKVKLCKLYKTQIDQTIKDKNDLFKPEIFYKITKEKNDYITATLNSTNKKLIEDWKRLWNEAVQKTYFNSFGWYLANQEIFKSPKKTFITCYKNNKLVGIVPLSLIKKYGIWTYGFLGNQYLDKSSILTINNDPKLLISIFEEMLKLGSFFLVEIDELMSRNLYNSNLYLGISKCSQNYKLPFLTDPLRYFISRHKNPLMNKLKNVYDDLRCKVFFSNVKALKNVSTIELQSSKRKEFKDVFSDPILKRLCLRLEKHMTNSTLTTFLYLKNEPIAYQYGFLYNHIYHLFQMGFKKSYGYLSPGKTLLYYILPKLSRINIHSIDFSRGTNRLKKEFTPFSYSQHLIFYSNNQLIFFYWKCLSYLKNWLEKYPKLFNIARKIKILITNMPRINISKLFFALNKNKTIKIDRLDEGLLNKKMMYQ